MHLVHQLVHDRLVLVEGQILVLRDDIQKNFCPETLFFEHIDDLREVFGVLLGHVLLYLHTYFLEALILPLEQVFHQVLLSKGIGQPPLFIFFHLLPERIYILHHYVGQLLLILLADLLTPTHLVIY